MKKIVQYLGLIICLVYGASCRKDFLDARPNKALLIPETIQDLRALLDNNLIFNRTPGLLTLADGDFFTTDAGYNAYSIDEERRSYTWAKDIFGISFGTDWNAPYQEIFYSNVVLEALDRMPAGDAKSADGKELRGAALFHRAFCFYHLAQQFALPYRAESAATDPGIPLKLTAAVTDKIQRGSVADTYARIIADLREARMFLPVTTANKARPNLAAAYGMLAKTYLAMEDYAMAGIYADSCLQQRPALINYNTLSTTTTRPFPRVLPNGNDEVIFYAVTIDYSFTGTNTPTVADPALYASYEANDLRKVVLYRALAPGFKFKGNYAGILSQFSGLATDEMYLIRAECSARSGKTAAAVGDMNKLLSSRWKTGTYVPITLSDPESVLRLVIAERRKELAGRGTRWADLRRLNRDPRFAVTLNRTILGSAYMLEPGSKRYVYPIPPDEVQFSGIAQNER